MSTEPTVANRVRDYFHADARRFDAIYEDEKGFFSRWADSLWRGVVRRRLELTLRLLEPLAGKTVLDVGCGSGRYCLAFAERGAIRVVGVDFAAAMIDLANDYARRLGVQDRCEFRAGLFPDVVPDGPFDVSTAMGFFDYIADPVPLIARLRELTGQTIVMSFPKAFEWRVPVRRLRFRLNGCPLFLYSAKRVRRILGEAGITRYDWVNLGRDYLVVARL
jgi:2-polyprenyl-3-methyl-5-hydroxy-6-metoxy-1,4-benzoquinol methylase